jgi:hypothetical protein
MDGQPGPRGDELPALECRQPGIDPCPSFLGVAGVSREVGGGQLEPALLISVPRGLLACRRESLGSP